MARWTRIPAAALLALAFATPAQASHGTNVFSGNWTTNIGPVAYAVISESDGAAGIQSLGGQPCGAPTTYYRGFYTDQNGNGVIVACEQSLEHLVGRYLHEDSQDTGGDGGLDVTFNRPSSFAGHYTADNFPGQTFPYSGTFQSHIDGDGCCPASAPPPTTEDEEPPPSQQQVNPCGSTGSGSASIAQADEDAFGLPKDEYCYIITTGPERGKVVRGKIPKPAPGVKKFDGEIGFVDDQGNRVEGPSVAAVQEKAEAATAICYTLLWNSQLVNRDLFVPDNYTTCIVTVGRILARRDQILQRRSGNPGAAARSCLAKAVRKRNRRRARPKLRVSCTRTASGMKITIRPRSRRRSLRAVLGGRAPRLLIGRSALGPAGPVQAVQVWSAK